MKLFDRIAVWLIAKAMKTPYSHLPGYMSRYWLIPYHPKSRSVSESGSASTDPTKYPGQFPILASLCSLFGIAARVHHVLRSDDDRAFHDHPWGFISVILKGGYYEYRPHYDNDGLYCGEDMRWYGPGSVIFRKAKDWHRLVLPEGQTAWTLFITFKWRQRWGFLRHPDGKVYFKDYLEDRQVERVRRGEKSKVDCDT